MTELEEEKTFYTVYMYADFVNFKLIQLYSPETTPPSDLSPMHAEVYFNNAPPPRPKTAIRQLLPEAWERPRV